MIPQMYINPAVVAMFIAMLMAFITVGGVLWKLATTIGDVKRDVAVIGERLNGHIEVCGPKKQHS